MPWEFNFKVLELVTLTSYSEMQYDVQNDRPCCRYSRMFWSLVTSTVCAASFTLAQWATVKSSFSFPCKRPSSQSGATLSILRWHLAEWSTMVPLPLFCHSIPSPIHLGLECWMFSTDSYPDESCDGQCSLCVLEQRMLGCWDEFQRSEANGKHQLSCFIDRSWSTVFAVHQHSRHFMCNELSVRLVESWVMAMKVSVTSGKVAHAFHAVFLPIPNFANLTSHPVNEWKKRK